ncbi:DUF1450 domain-containing protein [Sulfurovum sp. AR]|uniref:DUF1450 domain-containing protein n=1 Tax=Sulfurovum sp. AR TaxID=1165841 RepID=UPI00025C49C8|nr:DUF1450 domain-containing protein [Sulfurovum sp. AR]EIF51847.1 hypothetical protein SULAR_00030 [Sulfurovum sp. AR]
MKIQLCKKFSKVDKLQKKLTKAFPYDAVTVKSCISMCKQCKKQPVAKVDGKKQKAKSISKLLSKIEEL